MKCTIAIYSSGWLPKCGINLIFLKPEHWQTPLTLSGTRGSEGLNISRSRGYRAWSTLGVIPQYRNLHTLSGSPHSPVTLDKSLNHQQTVRSQKEITIWPTRERARWLGIGDDSSVTPAFSGAIRASWGASRTLSCATPLFTTAWRRLLQPCSARGLGDGSMEINIV